MTMISHLLGAGFSSIYQWLREGKAAGAIRWWRCQQGILSVAIGGLFPVCRSLKLEAPATDRKIGIAPWGVTAEVGLHQILDLKSLRAAATASATQRLQQLSRFAAWRKLPAPARKAYRLPQPGDFFPEENQRLSDNSAKGSLRCVIHLGKRRIWTSRGFIPFGVSQNAIARERGICDRTVRRHLALMDVGRRQVVQSKAEYKVAAECLVQDAGGCEISENVHLRSSPYDPAYWLNEKGLGGFHAVKAGNVGFDRIQSRFFTYGKKPKTWLYRTNLYNPTLKLCSVAATRSNYRRLTRGTAPKDVPPNVLQTFGREVDSTFCNRLIFGLKI